MKKTHGMLILSFVCLALLAVACSGPKPPKKVVIIQQPPVQGQPPQGQPPQGQPTQGSAQIPNPASQNCVAKGGQLTIVKDGAGGEYGVCTFTDNMQCEEWALFRGDCPVGGIKITGYITPAAVYCAITAGDYKVTGQSNTQQEQGSCTFKNGKVCDVWDLWNEKCSSNQ
jgi:putative hemolysin